MPIKALALAFAFAAAGCFAQDAKLPYIDKQIDPAKSYWTEHVHYSFPVEYAKVADKQNRMWEIAYADLYRGDAAGKAKAPVLVLLHGRAMNSGYWGELMQAPLAAGWRVVSIDWSHSGKSMPRNMHLPINRNLDDSRRVVHNLVVKHLGIAKASYLGHSLGGQLAAGYALDYPANVERLVLYAPGGLESVQPLVINGVRIDDPDLANSPAVFDAAWEKLAKTFSIGSSREDVERFFYMTPRAGTMPYLQRSGTLSEFIVNSRASALHGNPAELKRYAQSFVWDTMSSLMEVRGDDAQSLSNRISRIPVPTMVALGLKESAFPMPGTGNTNLVTDVVQPFYTFVRLRKSPIQIKLYDNAGHFIHTDLPEKFSADVLQFLKTGKVAEPVYDGDVSKYQAPERKPIAQLPDGLDQFKVQYEQAMLSRNLAAVKEFFAADFKQNGNTREDRLSFISSFIGAVERWEFVVYEATPKGDLMEIDFEIRNNFGRFADKTVLKKAGGQWRFFGNQQ